VTPTDPLRVLSLFAGIGAFDLGLAWNLSVAFKRWGAALNESADAGASPSPRQVEPPIRDEKTKSQERSG
jgi:hypothetical protein